MAEYWDPNNDPTDAVYVDAAVWGDWSGKAYAGQVLAGQFWNGWAIPRFPRAVADEIVADQKALADEYGFGDGVNEVFAWDGDDLVIRATDGEDEYEERIRPDADGCYDIGAMSWCWETVAPDEWEAMADYIQYREPPFVWGGHEITDPTMDETGRHPVDSMYYRKPNPETYATREAEMKNAAARIAGQAGEVVA